MRLKEGGPLDAPGGDRDVRRLDAGGVLQARAASRSSRPSTSRSTSARRCPRRASGCWPSTAPRFSAGGAWEEDGELWAQDGTLVAQSRQLAMMRERGGERRARLPRARLQPRRPARARCRPPSRTCGRTACRRSRPRRCTRPSRSARCSTSRRSSTPALRIETALGPEALLDACKAVERALGRARGRRPPRPAAGRRRRAAARRARATRPSGSTIPHRELARAALRARPAARARPGAGAARTARGSPGARRARGPGGAPRRPAARRSGGRSSFAAVRGRVWPVVVVVLAPRARRAAEAATYCVGVRADGLHGEGRRPPTRSPPARADAERDTILLGRLSEAGPFADAAGRPVRVVGLGADADPAARRARPAPTLRLLDAGSSAARAADRRRRRRAGAADRRRRALRSGSVVDGRVRVRGGAAELSSVLVDAPAPGVEVVLRDGVARGCALEHVTVRGSGDAGVRGSCATAGRTRRGHRRRLDRLGLRARVRPRRRLAVGDLLGLPGARPATRTSPPTRASPGPATRGRCPARRVARRRPPRRAVRRASRTRTRSATCGSPTATATASPRRDMGALELQPPAPAPVAGNVLSNPGAEAGTPADDDAASPAPPQWTRSGSFTFVRYGTVAGQLPVPVAAGRRGARRRRRVLRRRARARATRATQVVDVGDAAPEIDLGQGSAALSALLGGYRASADGAIVEADVPRPGRRRARAASRSAPSRRPTAAARRTCCRARPRARCRR